MVNPDGVVLGNSRCSVSGYDLNRKWVNPDLDSCPEVYFVKKSIKKASLKWEIEIFCDLHGHSIKRNSFFYCCGGKNGLTNVFRSRMIPKILSRKSKFFSFSDCRFRITEDKISTARVSAFNEFKIQNSFTLETSFCGYQDPRNPMKTIPYTISDMMQLG